MKISNMLSVPNNAKLESLVKFNWLTPDLPTLIGLGIVMATVVVVLQYRQQTNPPEVKSLAWFMANPQEALAVNKMCFDNPQLKSSENCVNSLHALEVMHKGPNS